MQPTRESHAFQSRPRLSRYQVQLHTAVLRPAGGGLVGRNGFIGTISLGDHPLRRYTLFRQVCPYRLGPSLGERDVADTHAQRVSVARNLDPHLWIGYERCRNLIQYRERLGRQQRTTGLEGDSLEHQGASFSFDDLEEDGAAHRVHLGSRGSIRTTIKLVVDTI